MAHNHPNRKKASMSIYNEILNETKELKVLTAEQTQKVRELHASLVRHEEALDKTVAKVSSIADEASRVETLGIVKAEHIRATAAIRKQIEDITGKPVPITESISKVLDNASEITIKVSGAAGAALGKLLKTPTKTLSGFFKSVANSINE